MTIKNSDITYNTVLISCDYLCLSLLSANVGCLSQGKIVTFALLLVNGIINANIITNFKRVLMPFSSPISEYWKKGILLVENLRVGNYNFP